MLDIIVVGGGAGGIFASIIAARNGANVTLLERNDRVGKKILATGNGRCNYTNRNLSIENYHGENGKFAYSALSQLDVDMTLDFFEKLGISPVVEPGGKIFPLSFQASSVLDVLRYEMDKLNIEIVTEAFVKEIKERKGKFGRLTLVTEDGREFKGHKVIMATGGKALPNSGSDGNGYGLLKALGHSYTNLSEGLVQLELVGDMFKSVSGVRILGKASLFIEDEEIRSDYGDLLFTDYGISGPPILQLSSEAVKQLKNSRRVEIKLSILDKSVEEVNDYLLARFVQLGEKTLEDALIGFVNKKMILPIIKTLDLDKNKRSVDLTKEEIFSISKLFTDWKFRVKGSKTWKDAQVTVGGIKTSEVESSTMESKIVDGLYIIGELLDVHGDCGGYNLQWAWSSAYVAGNAAVFS